MEYRQKSEQYFCTQVVRLFGKLPIISIDPVVISNKGTLNKLKPQFKSGCLLRIKRLNAKSSLNGLLKIMPDIQQMKEMKIVIRSYLIRYRALKTTE